MLPAPNPVRFKVRQSLILRPLLTPDSRETQNKPAPPSPATPTTAATTGCPCLQQKRQHLPPIPRRQIRQDRISRNTPQRHRQQKFLRRILHCPRRQQKRHQRHRRRQQRRNRNRRKSPALKKFHNPLHRFRRQSLFQRFLSPLARQPVRDEPSQHRPDRRHHRIVKPQVPGSAPPA